MLGSDIAVQFNDDRAGCGFDDQRVVRISTRRQCCGIGHNSLFLCRNYYFISAATCARTILSGFAGGSPLRSLSTTSMPWTTSPTTVYFPLRAGPSANMMKNWLFAEFGLL